ncbi:aminotransferase class I/II-fold pyridoxal phosphate-dependent enzyme [bacterium]|nr:MAG: aminotransferase class I/II-fold pyridoxal phosphate-dependent enzyme [bacterium]
MFTVSDRFQNLPVHLFAEVDRMKREALAQGKDVIDLGVGDPDIPTPQPIIDACVKALHNPVNHRYPYQVGSMKYREAIVRFFKKRYRVSLDPVKNIIPLIGSKEGIAHFPLVFVNPGEVVLAPDPGYPAYITGTVLAGGDYYPLPLLKKNNYLMDFDSIPVNVLERAKLLFFNYPNNPTTGSADLNYFSRIAAFCSKHHIIGAHDAAYQELFFETPPPSFLQAANAIETSIEFHSLSKTFSMTGWRVGFAAGEASLVAGLSRIKTNIDTGLFLAIQEAAAFALDHLEELTQPAIAVYKKRRDIVVNGLRKAGFKADMPDATIYVWAEVPKGIPSMDFAKKLLDATGVVITPGAGLGKSSEGYFRISLTTSEERLSEAIRRMLDFSKNF